MKGKKTTEGEHINRALTEVSARIRAQVEQEYAGVDYDATARIAVESVGVWSPVLTELQDEDVAMAIAGGMWLWRPARGIELRAPTTGRAIHAALVGAWLARADLLAIIPPTAHRLRVLYHLARAMPALYGGPYGVIMGAIAQEVEQLIPKGAYTVARHGKRWALTVEQPHAREVLNASILPGLRGGAKKWLL